MLCIYLLRDNYYNEVSTGYLEMPSMYRVSLEVWPKWDRDID